MTNPLRGEAKFRAGDVERTLTFDVNVFCEIENETGFGVTELIQRVQGSPSFSLLRSIFCAGLQVHHPGTTILQAGSIMSDAGIAEMTDVLRRALQAAMPEAKEETANPPKPAAKKRAGTG